MNNQIGHTPAQSVLFKKEELDIEYQRNLEKLNKIEIIINKILDKNLATIDIGDVLRQLLSELDNYIPKYCILLNNLRTYLKIKINNLKLYEDSNLYEKNQNIKKERINIIHKKFNNIENNYFNCKNFEPVQMKLYYDELKECHNEYMNLYNYFEKDIKNYNMNNIIDKNDLDNLKDLINITLDNMKGLLSKIQSNDIYNKILIILKNSSLSIKEENE